MAAEDGALSARVVVTEYARWPRGLRGARLRCSSGTQLKLEAIAAAPRPTTQSRNDEADSICCQFLCSGMRALRQLASSVVSRVPRLESLPPPAALRDSRRCLGGGVVRCSAPPMKRDRALPRLAPRITPLPKRCHRVKRNQPRLTRVRLLPLPPLPSGTPASPPSATMTSDSSAGWSGRPGSSPTRRRCRRQPARPPSAHGDPSLPRGASPTLTGPARVGCVPLQGYNTDWMRKYQGESSVALRPTTTAQVQRGAAAQRRPAARKSLNPPAAPRRCPRSSRTATPAGSRSCPRAGTQASSARRCPSLSSLPFSLPAAPAPHQHTDTLPSSAATLFPPFPGGSVPVFDEVVLSLSAMNKIVAIDPVASTATCQAGVVLEVRENAPWIRPLPGS